MGLKEGIIMITKQDLNKLQNEIRKAIMKGARSYDDIVKAIEGYAKKHGFKIKDGIMYAPGCERAILFSPTSTGVHLDLVVSPVYAMLDKIGKVLFV